MKKVIVIGSGPAGLSAALALSEAQVPCLMLERRERPGCKLLASGGGRCNFSNVLEKDAFMNAFGKSGRFMNDALNFAYSPWLLEFLHSRGVETMLNDDFYYFPKSGRASDVLNAFLKTASPELRCGCEVTSLMIEDGRICGVMADGEVMEASQVILAGGSPAWKALGSNAGLKLAEQAGHTIVKPLSAMAPLVVEESWVGSLAGVTLPDAELFFGSGRNQFSAGGSILFTHNGFSGFPALNLAGDAAVLCDKAGKIPLYLNVNRSMTKQDWLSEFARGRQSDGKKSVRSLLLPFMPKSLADELTQLAGCRETPVCRLQSAAMEKLPQLLTHCPLTLLGTAPLSEAMAMRGGVKLSEVNPATMGSRLVKGLHFAGEILDLAGPCGGYNMQWAFSSGRLAGFHCGTSGKELV